MNEHHMIAQCVWQTHFDQEVKSVELQNFISHWSNTVLLGELETVFKRTCPQDQTWRIDSLELDLKDIYLEDLARELPKRIRSQLEKMLDQFLLQNQSLLPLTEDLRLHKLEHQETQRELIAYFLLNGNMPWWYKQHQSILLIFDKQLDLNSTSIAKTIRQAGVSETARLRIVRQFGDMRLRAIVHVLEPQHSEWICSYADNLFKLNQQEKIPNAPDRSYREVTWNFILKHLIVDRGTLFNNVVFMRENLRMIAQNYQLDFDELIDQMVFATEALNAKGVVNNRFLSAIQIIHRTQSHKNTVSMPKQESGPDYWLHLQRMLHDRIVRSEIDHQFVKVGELFCALADQNAERLAELLRHEGKSQSVRQAILKNFSEAELIQLVQVIEPHEHEFIITHVKHTQSLSNFDKINRDIVWQVILTYLLVDRGSYFQRRQLVQHTMQSICQLHRIEYHVFLNFLIRAIQVEHPNSHRFALLTICHDLRFQWMREERGGQDADMMRPLVNEHEHSESFVLELIAHQKADRSRLWQALSDTYVKNLDDIELSERLVELVGLRYFPQLVQNLEPDAAAFCIRLIEQMMRWKSKGLLPSLNAVDFAFVLPSLILQSLPSFYCRHQRTIPAFDLSRFWERFLHSWEAVTAVPLSALVYELQFCSIEIDTSNKGILSLPETKDVEDIVVVVDNNSNAQLSVLSRYLLSRRKSEVCSDTEFENIWRVVCQQDNDGIRTWIQQSKHKYQLLNALVNKITIPAVHQWWTMQLPHALSPHQEILGTWLNLVRESGQWQGADSLLVSHLTQIFWHLIFDVHNNPLSQGQLEARMLTLLCKRTSLSLSSFLHYCQSRVDIQEAPSIISVIEVLQKDQPLKQEENIAEKLKKSEPITLSQDMMARYFDHPLFVSELFEILRNGKPSMSIKFSQTFDLVAFYYDLFLEKPNLLYRVLSTLLGDSRAMDRMLNIVPFSWLLEAIRKTQGDSHTNTLLLKNMFQCFEKISISGTRAQQMTQALFIIALRAWLKQDWSVLVPQKLVCNLAWTLQSDFMINKDEMQSSCEQHLDNMPENLRAAFQEFFYDRSQSNMPNIESKKNSLVLKKEFAQQNKAQLIKQINKLQREEIQTVPMRINNAGLVMLQTYIPRLFEGLGLLSSGNFISLESQGHAVHALQFLATGNSCTDEQFLSLNKLMCGLPLHHPIPYDWQMSQEQLKFCESLLDSVMQYWRENGSSSIEGFRGNWLVRDGSLTETNDNWALIVDRRPYDLLMGKSPFSYSIIKFPWMKKAIYVTWPL